MNLYCNNIKTKMIVTIIIYILIIIILIDIVIGKQEKSLYSANCSIILSSNLSEKIEVTKSTSFLIEPCEVALFYYRNFSIDGILEFSINNKSDPYLCNSNNESNIYVDLYNSVVNVITNTSNTINTTDYGNSLNVINTMINNVYNAVYDIIDNHFHNINSNKIIIVERGIIIIIQYYHHNLHHQYRSMFI